MNKIKGSILMYAMAILLGGCAEKHQGEMATAFSMSETMMQKCSFEEATLSDVKNEIRLFGKILANNNKVAQVNPVVSGVVKSINVGLGDYVNQGQVLATIQSSEVAAFRKEKTDAINDLAIAEKEYQVAKDLFEGKLNSERDVKVAEQKVEKAKSEMDRINEIFNIYGLTQSDYFKVKAPISGFIFSKNITINEQLRSDLSDPMFTIAEIKDIWAVANVNESDISKIEVGQSVVVNTLAFPDFHYKGNIEKIYNVIDPETRSMKIRVNIPNSDFKLKPEMNCTVEVHFNEPQQMIRIPSSAVIFDKSKYWAMVFHDKHNIETREVEVYKQFREDTYIYKGLKVGEKVIAENGLLVYDALND